MKTTINIEQPEMHGVRTPSPITIEVPSIVANKRKYLANLEFSSLDLTFDALFRLLLGNSSWKFETSLSSACSFGVNPTFAYRQISEYNANVPPIIFEWQKIYRNLNQMQRLNSEIKPSLKLSLSNYWIGCGKNPPIVIIIEKEIFTLIDRVYKLINLT